MLPPHLQRANLGGPDHDPKPQQQIDLTALQIRDSDNTIHLPVLNDDKPEHKHIPADIAFDIQPLGAGDIMFDFMADPMQHGKNLKRIRHSHHQVAKLLALKKTIVECAALTGYSVSRIDRFKNDPAFLALVSLYEEGGEVIERAAADRMVDVGLDALDVIHERLDETPELISTKDLLAITKTIDRAGAVSPHIQVTQNTNFLDAAALARLKQEVHNGHAGTITTIDATPSPADAASLPPDQQLTLGALVGAMLPPENQAERQPGEGHDLRTDNRTPPQTTDS